MWTQPMFGWCVNQSKCPKRYRKSATGSRAFPWVLQKVSFVIPVRTHLIRGVSHIGFAAFLGGVCVGQLHMEKVKDKAIESRTQAVAQAPDPRDHALDHACKDKKGKWWAAGQRLLRCAHNDLRTKGGTCSPCWSGSAFRDTMALMAGNVMLDMAATAPAAHIILQHRRIIP